MSKFLPWLINLTTNNMCLFLIWLCVASAWTIGSFLSSSFCQKTLDKYLPWTAGILFVTVAAWAAIPKNILAFSTLVPYQGFFPALSACWYFLVGWTCSSSSLSIQTWPFLVRHPGATRSFGLVIFQVQISSEWRRMVTQWSVSPWLGASIPPKSALKESQPWVLQAQTQLELSPWASLQLLWCVSA